MYWFLIPLLLGFACDLGSTFTTAFSRRWGTRAGTAISAISRDILGIPVWAAGFLLAALAASELLFLYSTAGQLVGWLLIALGAGVIIVALGTMMSRAVAPSVDDTLVRGGIYCVVRHPMHTGTLLEFVGLFLVRPTLPMALASAIGFLWVLLQTSLEERDLLQRLPEYKDYMKTVPRFLPRLHTR